MILSAQLNQNRKDAWRWSPETEGKFTVRSAYEALLGPIEGEDSVLFKKIWYGIAPSNATGFVWKVVIDRIQSRANMRRRNIIQ